MQGVPSPPLSPEEIELLQIELVEHMDAAGNMPLDGAHGILTATAAEEQLDPLLNHVLGAVAQDAADAAYHARSDFLNRMSHGLKSPLNHIAGFADILLGRHYGKLNAVQEEYLRDIMANSRELLSMINRLLDASQIRTRRPAAMPLKWLTASGCS